MTPKKKVNKNVPAKLDVSEMVTQDADNQSGFENMGADDIAIPFISLLQSLSPQCKGVGKIKGAKPGLFFNTVTNEVLGESIVIVPCAYEKAWVEWVTRENGGGFVNKYSDATIMESTTKDERGRYLLQNGNQVVTTAYHYCLLITGKDIFEQVVISLTSTQLKKSRKWNSQMMALQVKVGSKMIRPPMYSHKYTATSIEENNVKGEWDGWVIGNPEMISNAKMYTAAKQFNVNVSSGSVKTTLPESEVAEDIETNEF